MVFENPNNAQSAAALTIGGGVDPQAHRWIKQQQRQEEARYLQQSREAEQSDVFYVSAPTPLMDAIAGLTDKGSDAVFRPNHYTRYVIEPATFIAANKLPFDVGAIIKYVCRYDAKEGRQDVEKAKRFCEMLLERIDREARVKAGELAADVWKEVL